MGSGNAFIGGEDRPFPDGFELARPYIRHVHFKDGHIDPVSGQRAWVVDGSIDWAGALTCLKQDGFDGYISVETHVRPKVASTLRCLERLRRLVHGVRTRGGVPSTSGSAAHGARSGRVMVSA